MMSMSMVGWGAALINHLSVQPEYELRDMMWDVDRKKKKKNKIPGRGTGVEEAWHPSLWGGGDFRWEG